MKVMVMTHPVNTKCFEVLFSNDGKRFVTVDGFNQKYIEQCMGYTVHTVKEYSAAAPQPYRILAKCLAEKLLFLNFHVRYKDERKILSMFKQIGERLCNIQSRMEEDLDIPEVVQTLVNTPIS